MYTLENNKWSGLSGLTYDHCIIALITVTKVAIVLIWASKYSETHFHISFFIVSYRKIYHLGRGICIPWTSALGSYASQILSLQFQVISC